MSNPEFYRIVLLPVEYLGIYIFMYSLNYIMQLSEIIIIFIHRKDIT